jgi:hypothetical protein
MTIFVACMGALWAVSLLTLAVLVYIAPEMDEDGRVTKPGRRLPGRS